MKGYRKNKVISKSNEVLKYLAKRKTAVSGQEVALALGLPYGTVMGYLATHEDDGFVRRDGERYELGLTLASMWFSVRDRESGRRREADDNLKAIGAVI